MSIGKAVYLEIAGKVFHNTYFFVNDRTKIHCLFGFCNTWPNIFFVFLSTSRHLTIKNPAASPKSAG